MRLRISRTFFALSLAFLFLLPAHALAQTQTPARRQSAEWRSFRGTVGKYKVQMRLRRAGEVLSGTYFYENVRVGTYFYADARGSLRLEGTIYADGHFTLHEFNADDAQTGLFKGTWDNEEREQEVYLTGQWSRPDGTRQTEFSLAEMFVAFSAPAFIFTREIKDTNKRLNFQISVEYPQVAGMPAAAGFNAAARALAAKEAADFRKGVADYLADYRGEKPSGPGNSLDLGYYVDYADNNLVSIGFTEDTYYAGAAHPNHATVVLNYDLKAGRALRLADLFRPGSPYLKTISDYCLKELKGDSDLEGTTDMIDAGASARLENYRNWLVKRQGLEITFDPYQVGPYVAGPQYVTIPYKALAKIINPAGPLAPFLK